MIQKLPKSKFKGKILRNTLMDDEADKREEPFLFMH
jgi:hypothetical protein